MRKTTFVLKATGAAILWALLLVSNFAYSQCLSGTLEGYVYIDSNFDGISDPDETGKQGVLVRVFASTGQQVGQAITGNNGYYTIQGLNDGDQYRLEYDLPDGSHVSAAGVNNRTDVQFVTVPFCDSQFGLIEGTTNCDASTELFLTCFVNGLGSNSASQATIVGLTHNFISGSTVTPYATRGQTGAVWGLAFKNTTRELFSAAFVKQHAALGPNGHDAIYRTVIGNPTQTSLFTKLSSLGQITGNMTVTDATNCDYGKQVGKIGLGGLEIDENEEFLYVINLFNNTVVKISTSQPTPGNTQSFQIPNPGCSSGDYRAFALKFYGGDLYVGVTCTAETSKVKAETGFHIFKMNVNSGDFELIFSTMQGDNVWDETQLNTASTLWLKDIEFTDPQTMILGIADKIGDTYCNNSTSRLDDQYGDILMAYYANGKWNLESNGHAGSRSGTGINNGEGPGGGEFFGEDAFPKDPQLHSEVSLGALFALPTTNEVVVAVYDPLFNTYSGGLHRYNALNGRRIASRELYNHNIAEYFGKASGIGDITAGCGALPIEIGNYAWIDENNNGVQDPGENPLKNYDLVLLDDQCNEVGFTTTDNNGNYSFNNTNVDLNGDGTADGLLPGQNYYIVFDPSYFDAGTQSIVIDNNYYYPTAFNSDKNVNSDLSNDNDPCNDQNTNLMPMVQVLASSGNDPSFDMGLNASTNFDLALRKQNTSGSSVKIDDLVEFEIEVFNQGGVVCGEVHIVDYLSEGYDFNPAINPGWTLDGDKLRKVVQESIIPGASIKEKIRLNVKATNNFNDYTNIAEITGALDHKGQPGVDSDSTPDDDPSNDKGGVVNSNTDDIINNDGTLDEDDHDPATTKVFDLALDNIIRDDRSYDIGEQVTFDYTIYNQGNITAATFDVASQFPEELEFNPALNAGWTMTSGSTVGIKVTEALAPGEKTTVSLVLSVKNNNAFQDIINYAEITSFTTEDPEVLLDFDSTPDNIFNNDKGGDPYGITDNMIDDHGSADEDDHDPAFLNVRRVDLALRKTVLTTAHIPGDDVQFEIYVVNQGDISIQSIMIADYLPDNTTINDNSWKTDPSDPTGRIVTKDIFFTNGLAPGESITETISIKLGENINPGQIINEAEIAFVKDMNGMDVSDLDFDSKADMKKGNDAGGQVNSDKDDKLDGNGFDDEDDHDPAALYVATIGHLGPCDCLDNATNPFNGQFLEQISVEAPSGQTWWVDFALDIYDPASPAPPALPVPFTTGMGGYTLTEFPISNGQSSYLLEGIIIDDQPYSIRVFNNDGAFLQISGGGAACSYNDIVIESPTDGLSAVCTNTTHEYRIANTFGCNSFDWFLNAPAGNASVVSDNNNRITVEYDGTSGVVELTAVSNCSNLCISPISTTVNVGLGDGAMACRQNVNVSLGLDCSTTVDPDLILTNPQGGNVVYQVMLLDEDNDLIPNNLLTEDHLGTTVTAKVIDPCLGNSCWAELFVEDKMPPIIQCDSIQMACWQMDTYEPIVFDNCTSATWEMTFQSVTPLHCNPDFIKEINRTYIAEDENGNISQPCNQRILLERIDLDSIIWPNDFLIMDFTALSCTDSLFDENGFPKVEVTGVPEIVAGPLYPNPDVYCNLGVEFEDFVVTEFGCLKKIMRTWTVYEAWCTVGTVKTWTQTIEISDMEIPVVECPADVEISTGGGPDCTAQFTIPLPVITDDCSTEFEIDITYPGGFLDNVESPQTVTLDAGVNEILFQVSDGCNNPASCTMFVTVLDQTAPVAVCEGTTIVSLRSDGTAKAFAHVFDDGSYDDCGMLRTLVRRMGTNCDCEIPVYTDMRYLGERNGRFYYLSSFKVKGFQAFAYSEAYGGFLTVFETQEEHDWVFNEASGFVSGNYYIGLSDRDHEGSFTWPNHASPAFNQWEGGAPVNTGNYVVTNGNGNWMVVPGSTDAYFLLEVSNPCTFNNEIHFCCADVAEDQLVQLRAIDEFGRYNECMVTVEVQDKVPPLIDCPPNTTISCSTPYDLADLSAFGEATASDVCGVTITEVATDTINLCMEGSITRVFTASDLNGANTCEQTIEVINTGAFDPSTIIWPEDFASDAGCGAGDLLPENLPFESSEPQFEINECDLVDASYSDQTFQFAGGDTAACLKILRTWTVFDWCAMEDDPDYEPEVYQQTIKITNSVGPEIVFGCDTLIVTTDDCDFGDVSFSVIADDDCTPDNMLDATLEIDENSDGDFDYTEDVFSNVLSFDGSLAVGEHVALASYADMCGNRTTCAKIIRVVNTTLPTAACINGLTAALVPMDLDDDGTPDTEMTCIFPDMIDASSTHLCGFDINLSFSADTTDDKIVFDCDDLGFNTVTLWVTDESGNTAICTTTVEVQDNNFADVCPRFDLALIKQLDTDVTPGPFTPGSSVSFTLNVINQGNIPAYDIELVDYIPEGLILNDPNWTEINGKAYLDTPIQFLEDSTDTEVNINFVIESDFMGFSLVNTAEISAADDDQDPDNEPMEDSDSEFDDINNDVVGGDDIVDNTNGDEDDHDIETIEVEQIFDLALTKVIASAAPFTPGSTVTFNITVFNQGTLDAHNVSVSDHIPAGMSLNDSDWTENAGVATINTPIPTVSVGSSVTVGITLDIDMDFMGSELINVAEIVDYDDPGQDDEDSDPDTGIDEDDLMDGIEDDDEDDEIIQVTQEFDLAITKVIDLVNSPAEINPGDDVTYTITVYNQGTLDAFDVKVEDYVSPDMSFNGADNTDFVQVGSEIRSVIPFVPAGGSASLSIVLQVDSDFTGSSVVNNAEITNATNAMGLVDEDDPLSNTNDGTTNELASDNDINDEAPGTPGFADNPNDEDDYDPALTDVVCDLPPICVAQDITVSLDGDGMATITAAQVDDGSTAQCDESVISLSINNANFDCADIGDNPVVLTVTDSNGTSSSCSSTVTVEDDMAPVFAVCSDVTFAYENGQPVVIFEEITGNTESDNCSDVDLQVDYTNVDLELIECIPMTVVLVLSDDTGNSSTCSFTLTIENEPPTAVCQDITVGLDANGNVSIAADQLDGGSTDDCTVPGDLQFAVNQSSFDCTDIGDNVVILTVTDETGQSSTCNATVTVEDNVPPNALCQDRTVFLNVNGLRNINASFINNGSTDNCTAPADLALSLNMTQFNCSHVDMITVVTLTVTDEAGNSDICTANVTVLDNMNPTATCANPLTLFLGLNGEVTISENDIIISSDDNCTVIDESIDINMFDCSDIGSPVVVTATVTDQSGNTGTCTTTVTVEDNLDPDCTVTANNPIPPLQPLQLSDFTITTSDNCNVILVDSISPSQGFDCNMLGMQTVIVTVSDESGNSATCSGTVTVEDISTPVCEAMDITVSLDANGDANITAADVDAGSTAGCAGIDTLTVDPTFFACNDVGDNPVTLVVTSNNGMSASCAATVTIVDDTPPVVACADVTLQLDANGQTAVTADDILVTSTDGCGIDTEVVDISLLTCADKSASTTVTVTVTDMNGNSSTCSAEVTVEDNIAPECTLLTGLQFVPDVTISVADVLDTQTDNCAVDVTATVITTQTEFDCSDVGFHTTEVMVTDTCGNSNVCSTMIEIIDDSPPVCQAMDITVTLDINGEYMLDASEVDDGSAAVCGGGVTLEVDPDFFDCTDVGDNVVTLTVTSSGGESSTCTAIVTVEDNSGPSIVCPADMTLDCQSDLNDLTLYGSASAMDNCNGGSVTITESATFNVNACNVGTVTRLFTATDVDGNTATCEQILTIEGPENPITENDIIWPDPVFEIGNCIANPDSIFSGFPEIDTSVASCYNIEVQIIDFDPTPMTTGCQDSIIRTFTVIDSCQIDPNTGAGGTFMFNQVILLNDTIGPMIDGPSDTLIYLMPDQVDCDTFINLPAIVTDCVPGFSATNDSPHADNPNSADASGTYPGGETIVTITAVDNCGNESTYSYSVTVLDTTDAFVSCIKIIETIMPNMTAVVTTDQAGSITTSSCMDTIFTLSFSNTEPDVDSLILGCNDVGLQDYTIYLWEGNVLLDSCTNLLQVLDGGGHCSSPFAGTIEGSIHTEDGRMVDDVWVDLEGSPFEAIKTEEDGKYAFPEMPFGGSYEVRPEKDIDPLNGVSTLDLIKIQRHILGIEQLDSPYKYIAADIDNSQSITTIDLIQLRKLILGLYQTFPENKSWRMVDAGYKFVDQYNPFLYDIPEEYEIPAFDQPMHIDFIGVKTGDVNNSALANSNDRGIDKRAVETYAFEIEEERVAKGDIAEVVISANDIKHLDGYQFTLKLNTSRFDILEFIPLNTSMSMINANISSMNEGIIHLSWNRDFTTEYESGKMFALRVQAKENAWLSELADIDNRGIPAEAYVGSEILDVGLNFISDGEDMNVLKLYQNHPNPWMESTEIRYYAPESGDILLNIYDINGRMIHTASHTAEMGMNKIHLHRSQISGGNSILYYEIVSGDVRLMEKMLLIK